MTKGRDKLSALSKKQKSEWRKLKATITSLKEEHSKLELECELKEPLISRAGQKPSEGLDQGGNQFQHTTAQKPSPVHCNQAKNGDYCAHPDPSTHLGKAVSRPFYWNPTQELAYSRPTEPASNDKEASDDDDDVEIVMVRCVHCKVPHVI